MIACAAASRDRFRCPDKWELWTQIMALLPRGRAWQTHDAGMEMVVSTRNAQLGALELGANGLGTLPSVENLTGLQRYWAAYATVLEYLHARACALLEEFFCSSTNEMRDDWADEYGFPDSCEPWDTLCDKVRATGGSTCAYLASLAARLGYDVECRDCGPVAAVADCMTADCTPLCQCEPSVIHIRIKLATSAVTIAPPNFTADALVADCSLPCSAVPDSVICLIERYKPAHVKAIYEVI